MKTADGLPMFNIYKQAGETESGKDWSAAVFKIQFFTGQLSEEWHGNGEGLLCCRNDDERFVQVWSALP